VTTEMWNYVTDFGDSSVTLTIAAFLLIYLLAQERWRAAGAWVVAVAACGVGMALLKIAFRSCVHDLASAEFTSASGHAAMSATVYGGFAMLLTVRPVVWHRFAIGALAIGLVAAIAVSRVILGMHQRAEVIAGLLIGIASVLLFRRLRGRDQTPLPVLGPIAGALALIALTHGERWPIEEYLTQLAALIRHHIPACS